MIDLPTDVIGFHGTNHAAVPHLLAGDIQQSDEYFEWLGSGFYPWQEGFGGSPRRACQAPRELGAEPPCGRLTAPSDAAAKQRPQGEAAPTAHRRITMHANDLFATITDQLIADIEAGVGTWRMPWHTLADAGTPLSIDHRPYRGLIAPWLPMVAAAQGWTCGVRATDRGWQRHDAQVRRGEKGTQVVLWKPITTKTGADDSDERGGQRGRLLVRAYTVFAAEQVDGAEAIIARRAQQLADRDTPERIEICEANFRGEQGALGRRAAHPHPHAPDVLDRQDEVEIECAHDGTE